MRLIGTLDDERKAKVFSQFLTKKGVAHEVEIEKENDWGSPSYGSNQCHIWIYDEELLKEVYGWFQLFIENPDDAMFYQQTTSSLGIPVQPLPSPSSAATITSSKSHSATSWENQPMGWITKSFFSICCILFFLSQLLITSVEIPQRYSGLILFTSPVEKALLFDYPKFYELINRFIQLYGYEALEHQNSLPAEGQSLLQKINQTPFWPGYYQLLLKGGWHSAKTALSTYPTFEKIREGQLWRLFTPCLLHADLFHIFFNMLWLIVLGKQMEQRLSPLRYIFFILTVGIVSNTAQYLISGPNFIGFSGILCGMLAFIWMRQKRAAWEGYQIDRLTLIFMLLFIMSMAGIQLLSFILEKSFALAFSPNIANMAHLTGGVMGFIYGRLSFFSWRHR